MMNRIKGFGKKSFYTLISLLTWLAIMAVTLNSIRYLKTEHYQGTETPNPQFQVMVFKPINQPQAIYLKEFQNQVLVIPNQEIDWYGEDFLRNDNAVLTYHHEGALDLFPNLLSNNKIERHLQKN